MERAKYLEALSAYVERFGHAPKIPYLLVEEQYDPKMYELMLIALRRGIEITPDEIAEKYRVKKNVLY